MTQYYCAVENLFLVPPSAFFPAPKVDSAIVRLVPHRELPHPAKDEKLLAVIVRRPSPSAARRCATTSRAASMPTS